MVNWLEQLDLASREGWDLGYRLLHTHRWAEEDVEQVRLLTEFYEPYGKVLDAGCGFGEVARLMAQHLGSRADFTLLNISDFQLSKCPPELKQIHGYAELMPFVSESFDTVMFNTALLNMNRQAALEEAHRVLVPGGQLCLSDVIIPVALHHSYPRKAMLDEMHADVSSFAELVSLLYSAGFRINRYALPAGHTAHMWEMGEVTDRLFTPLQPILLRCTKYA